MLTQMVLPVHADAASSVHFTGSFSEHIARQSLVSVNPLDRSDVLFPMLVYICPHCCRETPGHAKAFYRRAKAHTSLGNFDQAQDDLIKWKEADPAESGEAHWQLARLRQQKKAASVKQKQQFKDFFDR